MRVKRKLKIEYLQYHAWVLHSIRIEWWFAYSQHEWHCMALLCWCAINNLLADCILTRQLRVLSYDTFCCQASYLLVWFVLVLPGVSRMSAVLLMYSWVTWLNDEYIVIYWRTLIDNSSVAVKVLKTDKNVYVVVYKHRMLRLEAFPIKAIDFCTCLGYSF